MVLDSKGYLIDWLQEKIVWQVFLGIDLGEASTDLGILEIP